MSPVAYSKSRGWKDSSILRLGLFGGTFDPPHNGHGLIAQAALDYFGLSRVVFIPCKLSPHKESSRPTSAAHRLQMLKALLANQPRMEISTHEIRRKGLSYSYETVSYFKKTYPGAELFWIMGSDQWEVFHKWKNYREMAAQVKFIVFPRPHEPKPRRGMRSAPLGVRVDVSATMIRHRLKNGEPVRFMLPEAVEHYIRLKKLYHS